MSDFRNFSVLLSPSGNCVDMHLMQLLFYICENLFENLYFLFSTTPNTQITFLSEESLESRCQTQRKFSLDVHVSGLLSFFPLSDVPAGLVTVLCLRFGQRLKMDLQKWWGQLSVACGSESRIRLVGNLRRSLQRDKPVACRITHCSAMKQSRFQEISQIDTFSQIKKANRNSFWREIGPL